MMKKILLSIFILFIGYILLIFIAPNIAGSIEKFLGINGFNTNIIETKEKLDKKSINIPSTDKLLSGAIDIKNTIINGANTTKEKIDTVRETLSGVQNTYNDVKDGYNNTKTFINSNSGKINKIKTVINNVTELNNTGTIN